MAHRSLRLAAARHVLGLAQVEELVNAADDAMNDGVYSQSLCYLGTCREPTVGECAPLFVAALEDLGIPLPDATRAAVTLLEHYVVGMVEGAATPDEALAALHAVQTTRYDRSRRAPVAALEPLRQFDDRYYAVEEFRDYEGYWAERGLANTSGESLERLHAGTLSLAEEWCRNKWGPAVEADWLTPDVLALASGVRADGAFDRLPILAEALQDAGGVSADLLDHLRDRCPHVRCCCVVDLLLGR